MAIIVAVGSTNPVKVEAVRRIWTRAFAHAQMLAVDVPSGVSDQPIGEEETLAGAIQRARGAREAHGADFGVGIEAGVLLDGDRAWMMGYTAICAREGALSWSRGIQVALPPGIAAALRAGRELGPIMDQLTGIQDNKKKGGAVGYLTDGLLDRTEALANMVAGAMPPHLHPELYGRDEATGHP